MVFYGIALIWVSVALGLTSLYVNLQNEATLIDSLTKLYNREYLLQYLNEFNRHHSLPYEVALSIGIGIYQEIFHDFDEFLKCIDWKIYNEKTKYYSTRQHDRRR